MATKPSPQNDASQKAREIKFDGILSHIHGGDFLNDLNAAHADVVEHVMTRSGKCKITITLNYKAGDDNAVAIDADIDVKKPKKGRRPQVIYADQNGKTFLDDPVQAHLALNPVISFSDRNEARESFAATGD